jgi:Protein of unknown function (DUF3540)
VKSAALKLSDEGVTQEMGRVIEAGGGLLRVRAAACEYEAKRALSCLVEPIADDIVLVALAPNGAAYVLAVLEREEGARVTLSAEGELTLRQRHGRLTIAAQDGIDLVAAEDISLMGRALRVTAAEGSVVVEKLAVVGGAVLAELDRVKLVAHTFDAVLDRLSQRVRNAFRDVEETDQVRAERIDYTATSTMSLHAENAVVTAEQLVKIDGEQIHLG